MINLKETLSDLYEKTKEAIGILEPLLQSPAGKVQNIRGVSPGYRRAYCGTPRYGRLSRTKESQCGVQLDPVYLRSIEDIFSEIGFFSGNASFAKISESKEIHDGKEYSILQTRVEFESGAEITLKECSSITKRHAVAYPTKSKNLAGHKDIPQTNDEKRYSVWMKKNFAFTPKQAVSHYIEYLIDAKASIITDVYMEDLVNIREIEHLLAGKYPEKKLFEGIGGTGAFAAYVSQIPPCGIDGSGEITGIIGYKADSKESLEAIEIEDVAKRIEDIEDNIRELYDKGLIEEMNKVLFL